jgi:hypothetical protein
MSKKDKADREQEPEGVSARVGKAYSAAIDGASSAAKSATAGFESNPVAALLGGLALGAAAGALIARSEREKALLAPLGDKLGNAARAAIEAGRAAGKDAIDDAGLDLDSLREQAAGLFTQARTAAGTVGLAAFEAAKDSARG